MRPNNRQQTLPIKTIEIVLFFSYSFCYKTTFSQQCMNNSRNFSSPTKRTDGSSSDDESGEKHSSTSDSSHSSDEKSKSDSKGK